MFKDKIKAPVNGLDEPVYIFDDFFDNISDCRLSELRSDDATSNDESNLNVSFRDGSYVFKYLKPICPKCYYKTHTKKGYNKRKINFLKKGLTNCKIQRYKCKYCNYEFSTDISCLVPYKSKFSKDVIDKICSTYATNGTSLRKIQETLRREDGIIISHQTVENILISYKDRDTPNKFSYSGYYLFDSLWVKIDGEWYYLLALFDIELNTIVNYEIVESEDEKTLKQFIEKSVANQNVKAITTDLKREYRKPINELGFKHQFCRFHAKQMINRIIRKEVNNKNPSKEEKEKIEQYKAKITNTLDSENFQKAREKLHKILEDTEKKPEVIKYLLKNLMIPYLRHLTYYTEDENIAPTSNKLENAFQKIFPKHIKKTMKTIQGVLKRFQLKLEFWNLRNENLN